MNSTLNNEIPNYQYWKKNLSLFKMRFPNLYELFLPQITKIQDGENPLKKSNIILENAKNGELTATQNSVRLHSAYNPQKEAEIFIQTQLDSFSKKQNSFPSSLVFFGTGLGYPIIQATIFLKNAYLENKKNLPEKNLPTIILIEPDIHTFFSALFAIDWNEVFKYEKLILLISAPHSSTIQVINHYEILKSVFFKNSAFLNHAEEYFGILQSLVERNAHKEKINNATTKKFARRWNMNCLKNAKNLAKLDSISIYKNILNGKNIPFCVIAAGPSLKNTLPYIYKLKKRSLIICVDTALISCTKNNIFPDFVIITDPQYWAYRHISSLKCSSSVLITSCDVYPSVFRLKNNYSKIVLSSSQLPIGKYFEKSLGLENSDLGAGGTVASCAFNFAQYCGAETIFFAGLDLSFPKKLTHIKGSTFEQATHITSIKTNSTEKQTMPLMFNSNAQTGVNYKNEKILTDEKMKMFAWWFESRIIELKDKKNLNEHKKNLKVYNLSQEGLKIPGIEYLPMEDVLKLEEITLQKEDFFKTAQKKCKNQEEINTLDKIFLQAEENLQKKIKNINLNNFDEIKRLLT